MANIAFLIGHPASGKTSLYSKIEEQLSKKGLTSIRLNDRVFFWKAMEMDADREYHQVYEDGSHRITDARFFEIQFHLLREALLETEWIEDWVFVELTSLDYPSTLQQIGADLLEECFLILVLAPIEVCLQRNSQRLPAAQNMDESRIPEHYIRSCYAQDFDLMDLQGHFRDAILLTNDQDDPTALERLASRAAGFLLSF